MSDEKEDLNIDRLADAIADRLKVSLEDRLWDAQDCADYFKVTKSSFLQYKASRHDFPRPHAPGHPRWFAREVIEWARANRAA